MTIKNKTTVTMQVNGTKRLAPGDTIYVEENRYDSQWVESAIGSCLILTSSYERSFIIKGKLIVDEGSGVGNIVISQKNG